MANPRDVMSVRGTGYRAHGHEADGVTIVYDATKKGGSTAVGLAVSATGTGNVVQLTADGHRVVGKLVQVDADGECAVQEEGGAILPSSGTINEGTQIVGALGPSSARGYIRSVVAATLADVAAGAHNVYDATDAAAVEVILGA